MALLKAPRPTLLFWVVNILVWGAFALANFVQRQALEVETLEMGLVSLVVMIVVCTVLCLIFREMIHRFGWIQNPSLWVWFKVFLNSVGFGFVASALMVVLLAYYLVFMGYVSRFIFFMDNVYNNWTITTVLMFLWAAVYISTNYALQLQKKELQLKDAQLNTLSGQLNPHFLFNGLNNIRGLMLENVDKSRHMLTALSVILRYALQSNKQTVQLLKDEIEIVHSYIDLASIQYEDRLNYVEEIEPELLDYYIPPMMIQLLVENALKHGIDRSAVGGDLRLNITRQEELMHIVVCNPGTLNQNLAEGENTGLGLRNIRKRLALMFANEADLSISQDDALVVATVQLPLIKEAI